MATSTLVDRLFARYAAGLPLLPIAGGDGSGDTAPEVTANPTAPEAPARPAPKAPEAKPAAAQAAQAHPDVEAPKAPEGTLVSAEQLERFRQAERERDALRAVEEARAEEARRADEARLIEEGKLKEVIAQKDEQLSKKDGKLRDTETKFKTTLRESALAVELSKLAWVEGATPKLMKLLRDELEVVPDGDLYRVQTRDGKPVEKYVAELHRSPDYAMFVPPASRGGAGTQGANVRPAKEVDPADPNAAMAAALKASYSARHENVPVALAGRNRLAGGRPVDN